MVQHCSRFYTIQQKDRSSTQLGAQCRLAAAGEGAKMAERLAMQVEPQKVMVSRRLPPFNTCMLPITEANLLSDSTWLEVGDNLEFPTHVTLQQR